LYTFKKEEAIV